jgi:integrase
VSGPGRVLGPGKLIRVQRGRGEPIWLLDYVKSDGSRVRQNLSRDRRVAERLRGELIAKRDLEMAGLAPVEGQNRPLAELAAIYVADVAIRSSRMHLSNVRSRLARVLQSIRARRVCDLRAHMLLEYRAQRVRAGVGHATVNYEVKHVLSMLRWAQRNGLIAESPVPAIKPLPLDRDHLRRRRRAMSDEEIERFLRAARDDDRSIQDRWSAKLSILAGSKGKTWNERPRPTRVPQFPVWFAFLETGARYHEMTSTCWGDLDTNARTLTLRSETTKSGKGRTIPLRDELVEELVALRAIHERVLGRELRSEDQIFRTPEGVTWPVHSRPLLLHLSRILKRAKIERVDAHGEVIDVHSLRHSAASRLARSGAPITHTQRILGHSSVEMTSKYYVHVGVEELREAVERVERDVPAPRRLRVLRGAGER